MRRMIAVAAGYLLAASYLLLVAVALTSAPSPTRAPGMSPEAALKSLPTLLSAFGGRRPVFGCETDSITAVLFTVGGPDIANPGRAAQLNMDGVWSVDWSRVRAAAALSGGHADDLAHLLIAAKPLLRTEPFDRGDAVNKAAAQRGCMEGNA